MNKRIFWLTALTAMAWVLLTASAVRRAHATVLTGAISSWPESVAPFQWGDGVHDLSSTWSAQTVWPEGGLVNVGYFYPSSYSGVIISYADVFVVPGLADVAAVADASSFAFSTDRAVEAAEGDTVFFRGTNGYYGAWRIDDMRRNPAGVYPYMFLSGQWYFQDNGTADFRVPEPSGPLLLITSLAIGAGGRRRFSRAISRR